MHSRDFSTAEAQKRRGEFFVLGAASAANSSCFRGKFAAEESYIICIYTLTCKTENINRSLRLYGKHISAFVRYAQVSLYLHGIELAQ
jgi:hypothetical protein